MQFARLRGLSDPISEHLFSHKTLTSISDLIPLHHTTPLHRFLQTHWNTKACLFTSTSSLGLATVKSTMANSDWTSLVRWSWGVFKAGAEDAINDPENEKTVTVTETVAAVVSHFGASSNTFACSDASPMLKQPLPSSTNQIDMDTAGIHAPELLDPSLTTHVSRDDQELGLILEPIHDKLLKLQATTKDAMPPEHHNVRAKTHSQVITERLMPVGEFIVQGPRTEFRGWQIALKLWYVQDPLQILARIRKRNSKDIWSGPAALLVHKHQRIQIKCHKSTLK